MYVFFDLVMHNIGVCRIDEIAFSVLTTVIGHQVEKGWVIIDAGWMAMSRDRGTEKQNIDFGYGQVCDSECNPFDGVFVTGANQEHGIINLQGSSLGNTNIRDIVNEFPVGMLLRVLPNHACATAAAYSMYHIIGESGEVKSKWDVYTGW